MDVETELKLRITPEQLAKLKRHALFKTLSDTRPVTRHLYNIYYDTPKLELHDSEVALRLRHIGRQWLQTLKGGGSVQAGLHQRNEWEVPVSGPALDFSVQGVAWDEHLPKALRKKLQPVFVTDFFRTSRMLNFRGAQIELCMDSGVICTEQRSVQVCELELELKSGEPGPLFELALAILEVVPFELETISKAEQGYRLLCEYIDQPVKGVAPAIAGEDMLADALKALIWSCLLHFQSNLPGVMRDRAMGSDDAEYLHQMRVALRRLRVVLRMVEKVCADRRLAELYADASILCVALGHIREWDVFIAGTVQPICVHMLGHTGLQVLGAVSERQRAACYATLRTVTHASDMQRLLLHFAIWMGSDYWQQAVWQQPAITQSVYDFAARRLRKLAKRFAQSVQQLNTADAAQLHALRIVAKKLRYSAEFFASLFNKQRVGIYLAALSEIQEVLGQINDAVVAHRLLDGLAADTDLAGHLEAIVLVRGWIARDLSGQLTALRKSIQNFNEQQVFWRK